jgi:glycosyltransferase involved in cell wall biosynthesis
MDMIVIVLVTTGQPSTNPRIVKEADALQNAGYDVTVLFCYYTEWASKADEVLLKKVAWKYQLIGGSPWLKKKLYLLTRIRYKIANTLGGIIGNRMLLAERAQARCYDELLRAAKGIKAHWYIGHNLGALPIVVKGAKHNNAKSGFDFEDYHRGEMAKDRNSHFERIVYLEKKYLPHLTYYSTSSSLIAEAVKKDHPSFKGPSITLLNCFPLSQQGSFTEKNSSDRSLHLWWFSQTIGKNRGLEILITAMRELRDPNIYLTLAGRCNDDMNQFIQQNAGSVYNQILLAGIIQPGDLPVFASRFDVGIATELPQPKNRNICLTNKIFTYLLAGNAIILSQTEMQVAFNKKFKVGELLDLNVKESLKQKIKKYQNTEILNAQKRSNYELAKDELNWEKESQALIKMLKDLDR